MAQRVSRRSALKAAGAAGIATVAGCVGGDADGYNWTMAAAVGEGHAFDIGAREFKSAIEELSDGEFTINVQVGGPYGGEVAQMETLAAGGVEMLSQSFGVSHATYHPEILGNTHILFIDDPIWDRWEELTETAWEATDGLEVMADQGLTITSPLGYAGVRHTTANQPIREPTDTDGQSIRLPELAMWPAVFAELGFDPTALAVDELYSALQQGTIDATEGEIYQVRSESLNEVQSHYSLTAHFPNAYHFMINTDIYESLSEDEQDLVDEASEQAIEAANEEVFEAEDELIEETSGDDFEIIEDVDREAFVEAAKDPIEQYYEENDPPLSLDEVRDIIRE